MTHLRITNQLVFALLVLAFASPAFAEADISIDVGPGRLVIWDGPKAEYNKEQIHVWWISDWYFRVAGKKIAEGDRTKFFDVTVDRKGAEGSSDIGNNRAKATIKWSAKPERNGVRIKVTAETDVGGVKKTVTLFDKRIGIEDDN